MTKETAIPVIHVKHNQDIEIYKGRVKEDKVYLKDERVAQFTNSGVFTVIEKLGNKTRRYKAVIYLDGKAECSEIRDADEIKARVIEQTNPETITNIEHIPGKLQKLLGNAYSIFEPLTDQDRKTVVKREIAKQLGKFKPIQTWQFIIILVMLGVIIALRFI